MAASTFSIKQALAVLGMVVVAAQAAAAPDVTAEISHRSVSMMQDGVKRTAEFSEQFERRGNTVWVARVLPAGAHSEAEHKVQLKDHKHADMSAATRWITHDTDGKVQLKLVAAHDKIVVDVAAAEFGTVGFDGSWLAAYHLIDPAVLKKLKPTERQGDLQWYQSAATATTPELRILWNSKLEMPMEVQSRNTQGTMVRSTKVKLLAQAGTAPWTQLKGYSQKDYSDFLD